jgi:hypothetical protein
MYGSLVLDNISFGPRYPVIFNRQFFSGEKILRAKNMLSCI